MLVLSRRNNEKLVIGEAGQVLTGPIEICVVEIRAGAVRLGVEADRDLAVDRPDSKSSKQRKAAAKKSTNKE